MAEQSYVMRVMTLYLILVYSGAQKTEFSYKDESFSKVEGFSQGKSVQKFCTNNVINK